MPTDFKSPFKPSNNDWLIQPYSPESYWGSNYITAPGTTYLGMRIGGSTFKDPRMAKFAQELPNYHWYQGVKKSGDSQYDQLTLQYYNAQKQYFNNPDDPAAQDAFKQAADAWNKYNQVYGGPEGGTGSNGNLPSFPDVSSFFDPERIQKYFGQQRGLLTQLQATQQAKGVRQFAAGNPNLVNREAAGLAVRGQIGAPFNQALQQLGIGESQAMISMDQMRAAYEQSRVQFEEAQRQFNVAQSQADKDRWLNEMERARQYSLQLQYLALQKQAQQGDFLDWLSAIGNIGVGVAKFV